jgi:metal-dependent HD superfamily phosphatase/phosphodiesterase
MHNGPTQHDLILFDRLRRDPEILELIERSDAVLGELGYTDHGRRHVTLVGVNAARVLETLGHDRRAADLAAVAGLLHDIGNVEGREGHAAAGSAMAYRILIERGVPPEDAAEIRIAVENHDEVEGGRAATVTSAALIIADKADIHRSRVRTRRREDFDIHDRVNFAVIKSHLRVDAQPKRIGLGLDVDHAVAGGEEIVNLFEERFALSDAAARFLECSYSVAVNGKIVR